MNCMFHSRTLLLVLLCQWSIFFAVGVNGGVVKARGSSPYLPVMKKAVARSLPVLSSAELSSFRPFSFYASTAYCQPSQILSWQCGANCKANPTFRPVAAGGDGSGVQFWYVGFDLVLQVGGSIIIQTVIVAHQGTVLDNTIVPLITDADSVLTNMDSRLFPTLMSSQMRVHNGFAREQAKTAELVLAAVQKALTQSGFKKVTIVGHSLGAAIALLDSIYLSPFLPGVSIRMIGYGMPRVGNKAFATYVDSHVDIAHVNNKKDPVPILPGRFLGYHHPGGEKHIQPDGSWVICPGQDNPDKNCSIGDVPNILVGKPQDHVGPYDGVSMKC